MDCSGSEMSCNEKVFRLINHVVNDLFKGVLRLFPPVKVNHFDFYRVAMSGLCANLQQVLRKWLLF